MVLTLFLLLLTLSVWVFKAIVAFPLHLVSAFHLPGWLSIGLLLVATAWLLQD